MKLLTKPDDYQFSNKKTYEDYGLFKFALTERNWIGTKYIEKADCAQFVRMLHSVDSEVIDVLGDINPNIELFMLVDTSAFAGELPINVNVIEFLEELDDFEVVPEQMSAEIIKRVKKVKSKFNFLTQKPNTYSYLYRWIYTHPEHPFADEFREVLDNALKHLGRQRNKKMEKNSDLLAKKYLKQNMDEEKMNQELGKLYEELMREEENLALDIMKYGLGEPLLFFFAVVAFRKYISAAYEQQIQEIKEWIKEKGENYVQKLSERVSGNDANGLYNVQMATSGNLRFLMTFRQGKKGLELKYHPLALPGYADALLHHESFLGIDIDKAILMGEVKSLFELGGEGYNIEENEIQLLKTIVTWVADRIGKANLTRLPKENWMHIVNDEYFVDSGFIAMTIFDCKTIQGPDSQEFLINTLVVTDKQEQIMFPILDPTSWNGLNFRQCALMAYAICLYHDICVDGNYELSEFMPGKYELSTKSSTIGKVLKKSRGDVTEKKRKRSNQRVEESDEYWVSFHFRRLRKSLYASPAAVEKAKRYGIKEVPKGFTFVDSYTKGVKPENPEQMNISALDVLRRTLQRTSILGE